MLSHGILNRRIFETIDELKTLFNSKQGEYTDEDSLSNFRRGAVLHHGKADAVTMYEVLLCWMSKHIAKIYNKPNLSECQENLKDLIVYSLIALAMREGVNDGERGISRKDESREREEVVVQGRPYI